MPHHKAKIVHIVLPRDPLLDDFCGTEAAFVLKTHVMIDNFCLLLEPDVTPCGPKDGLIFSL